MNTIPKYYKTNLQDIENTIKSVKKANVTTLCNSAGGRPVYMLCYGEQNKFCRTANLSSALGGKDKSCFVNKSQPDYKPTLLLVGCIHGGEFEGTAALLNLVNILETGCDFAGNSFADLKDLTDKINLLIISCLNPDGRSHVPFDSFVGKTFYDLRMFNQGTWKDGTLCGWPECKKIHPIKDYVDYLGGYFNDDGVNLMHDDFFGKKASETQALFDVCEQYVPDFTVLLHGGSNCKNHIIGPAYAPLEIKQRVADFEQFLKLNCEAEGLSLYTPNVNFDYGESKNPPVSFNLPSALTQLCGEPCVTYECNQGLTDAPGEKGYSYSEIYKHHFCLFKSLIEFLEHKNEKN
ncbi:MAG: hypothetical protein IKU82_02140 [Clostridia bacterium]|nr:hypothetical protein [Clostridia bacterium]